MLLAVHLLFADSTAKELYALREIMRTVTRKSLAFSLVQIVDEGVPSCSFSARFKVIESMRCWLATNLGTETLNV